MDAVLASGECGTEESRQLKTANARCRVLLRFRSLRGRRSSGSLLSV
ncbi:hypothetical protein [Xanthomonas campestris]|nr:hypothetical protein [Xanthomonas campestris]MCF8814805.1 hypothetical protein [Xanthomonas campestris pv. campestris]MEB1299867.1 hypothetical protein [Xanthomonas campestris pv. campestris]WDK83870.1 hypothetical protein JH311_03870 [Xanthomonas campestris pv. campestris]WDK90719.1 hypothetical protein JH289_17830 [Xanthomonas campestris pv. campestris]